MRVVVPMNEVRNKPEITIVYADDEPTLHSLIGDMLKAILRNYNVQLKIVNNGGALLDELRTGRYACAVTDHHMPEMTGFEALVQYRRENGVVPAVIITGEGVSELTPRMNALENTVLLGKPFSVDELRKALYTILPQTNPQY